MTSGTNRRFTAGVLNINEPELTRAVLRALAALADRGWQVDVVVVDNGSRADALARLRQAVTGLQDGFANARLLEAGKNLGASAGRNLILARSSGERILFLDNDLVLPHDDAWLAALWHRMDRDSKAAVVGPTLVFADQPDIVQATGIGLTASGRVGYLERGRAVDALPAGPLEVVGLPLRLLASPAERAAGRRRVLGGVLPGPV